MAECMPVEELAWLDATYVTKIMQSYLGGNFKTIKRFTKSPATVQSENYMSAVHLLHVDYATVTNPETTCSTSLFVKSRLDQAEISQIADEVNVFQREMQAYREILPELKQLMLCAGEDTIFSPSLAYIDDSILVLENLKVEGYFHHDIKVGLNFEQSVLVIKKLAKFHATSMALHQKNPDLFRYHLPSNVTERPSPLHDMYKNSIQTCIAFCKDQVSLQRYCPALIAFSEQIISKLMNVYSRSPKDRFHVLNHGDLWVNNLMFHKDDVEIKNDVIFVDYQEGFYGSPGIDFNYFLFMSCQMEVLQKKLNDLISTYQRQLVQTLKNLNYEEFMPTVEDVREEIQNKAYHGLAAATCLLPILINENPEILGLKNFLQNTKECQRNRYAIFNNTKFAKRLEVFFELFKNYGIL